jgi:hypothetical protein
VYDSKDNSIFQTRIGLPAGITMSPVMQAAIPFGPELPTLSPDKQALVTQQTSLKPAEVVSQPLDEVQDPVVPPVELPQEDVTKKRRRRKGLFHVPYRSLLFMLVLVACLCIGLGVYCIVVYSVTRDTACDTDLSMWILVYGIRLVVLLPFAATYIGLSISGRLSHKEPVVLLGMMLAVLSALFAVGWFILGNVWVFLNKDDCDDWLYKSCLWSIVGEWAFYALIICFCCLTCLARMEKDDEAIKKALASMHKEPDEFDHIP